MNLLYSPIYTITGSGGQQGVIEKPREISTPVKTAKPTTMPTINLSRSEEKSQAMKTRSKDLKSYTVEYNTEGFADVKEKKRKTKDSNPYKEKEVAEKKKKKDSKGGK